MLNDTPCSRVTNESLYPIRPGQELDRAHRERRNQLVLAEQRTRDVPVNVRAYLFRKSVQDVPEIIGKLLVERGTKFAAPVCISGFLKQTSTTRLYRPPDRAERQATERFPLDCLAIVLPLLPNLIG